MKKRITALLLVLVLGLLLALPAAASQGVNTYGLVDDGADLLTEEQEAKLTVYLKSLGERLDISLVVVTVDSLGSKSPKSYADTYYDTYGFLPDGALFLVVSCLVNIVLDLVFVAGFHMDVAGAALATIIAMYCSWLFSIFYIRKQYPELEFTFLPHKMNRAMLAAIIRIGLPLGLNSSFYCVGHIMMQSLINLQGSVFIAACSVSSKVTGIANVAITSLSSAATTFSGQNLGAENYRYLRKGGVQIPLVSGAITCAAGIAVTVFCRPILGLFTQDADVLAFAVRYIRIVLPFTWTYAVFNGIISFVNGMGEVRFPTIVNILMLWAVRIPVGCLIAFCFDGGYVMACIPVSFVFGMLCMLSFFGTKRWKEIGRLARTQQEQAGQTGPA